MELQAVRCPSQAAAPTDACAGNRRGRVARERRDATVCPGRWLPGRGNIGATVAPITRSTGESPWPPPASGGVAVDTCLVQRRHAASGVPASSGGTCLCARLGDRTHPVPDSALRGIERGTRTAWRPACTPKGWRLNHTEGPLGRGPSEGIFIHRANGTPAVVQESSVPGAAGAFPDRAPSSQSRS